MSDVQAKALTIQQAAGVQTFDGGQLTVEAMNLIREQINPDLTAGELTMFAAQCNRTGLDPLRKQIYAIKRYDKRLGRKVMQTQVGIDGFRKLANDTGKYRGQTAPEWCGTDGEWKEVWLSDTPPAAARVGILRDGFDSPLYGTAIYSEFVQTDKNGQPTGMWASMPANQLSKCAESLAFRKAFPDETGDLRTTEEMGQAENGPGTTKVQAPAIDSTATEIRDGDAVGETDPEDPPSPEPEAPAQSPPAPAPRARTAEDTPEPATPDQQRLILAKRRDAELADFEFKAILQLVAGVPHLDRLPKAKVDAMLEAVAGGSDTIDRILSSSAERDQKIAERYLKPGYEALEEAKRQAELEQDTIEGTAEELEPEPAGG